MPILGIDEVGRGPIAGPLVIGAALLNDFIDSKTGQPIESESWQAELNDSKKLSDNRRHQLDKIIRANAIGFGLGWVTNDEIDQIGISAALKLATRRAVKNLADYMKENDRHEEAEEIIIDGPVNFLKGTPLESRVTNLNKADSLIKAVSAASIVAKVARDDYMRDVVAKEFPNYGFENHVGYGTKKHLDTIKEFGPCKYHRLSVKIFHPDTISDSHSATPTKRQKTSGARAEKAVADFLATHKNHQIAQLNFRTRMCEIDVITETENDIYFTEVKYRKDEIHGSPKEFVTAAKQDQMRFSAETYLHSHSTTKNSHLAVASVLGDFDDIEWFVLD